MMTMVIRSRRNLRIGAIIKGSPSMQSWVHRWDNRLPATDGTVYLTNGPVTDPFVVFDTYDWRSVIENGIFKEGKHPWHLGRFPKKTEATVVVHCHFTLLVMTLSSAFRLWQAQQKQAAAPLHETDPSPSLSTALLEGEGTARWRLRLKEENRDKVIVFVTDVYGIFHLAELAVLTRMRLHRLPSHFGSPQMILRRYGISP